MNDHPSTTVTHVLEHLYCPRFTYYEYVLAIPERQERRWKVGKRQDSFRQAMTTRVFLCRKIE